MPCDNCKSNKYRKIGNKIVKKTTIKGKGCWNPSYFSNTKKYAEFWKKKIPALKEQLVKIEVTPNNHYQNTAIIHFRCSDVPFIKHRHYPLLPKKYFKFISKQLYKYNINKIIIMTCNTHNKHLLADKKCPEYSNIIKRWLGKYLNINIKIDNSCMSVKDTYAAFLGCKVLVSTGGSFSFIPGLLKGKHFISPTLYGENSGDYKKSSLHKHVHWTMWDKYPNIPQKDIDYSTFNYKHFYKK